MRWRGTLAATVVACGMAAGPADAARDLSKVPDDLDRAYETDRFQVHYTKDPASPHRITATQAKALATTAERAWVHHAAVLRMVPPLEDADGRIDVYVWDLDVPQQTSVNGLTARDSNATRTTSWIRIDSDQVASKALISHELFHVFQLSRYARTKGMAFLAEGSASWAAARFTGTTGGKLLTYQATPGRSLTCPPDQCTKSIEPYRMWPYFQWLSEHVHAAEVRFVFTQLDAERAQAFPTPADRALSAIDGAANRSQTTLEDTVTGWAEANAFGSYAFGPLTGERATVETTAAVAPGTPFERAVDVDRLAARYVRLRGPATCSAGCTTTVRVLTPPGRDVAVRVLPEPGSSVAPVFTGSGTYTLTGAGADVTVVLVNRGDADDTRFTVRAATAVG